ncbi:hypothetical protein [Streptomyces clavifer]|uniref:hypothetical protein n=1 Tax=Streptomyces clavifer TaxID=68188 RepID=UPI003092E1A3|nr:hypothetical protein OG388_13270 [Streptomyces clavifer]
MSFDEEWARQKQAVTDQQSGHTRLNQLPTGNSGPTGSAPDLITAPAAKKKAANTIQNDLEPGTRGAADAADESTRNAIGEFSGWDTGAGLKKAHAHWDTQVKRLMARLDSEKSSLRTTSIRFTDQDIATGQGFIPLHSKVSGV